jgi:hypothetical protein
MLPDSSTLIHSENTPLIHGRGKRKKNILAMLFIQFIVGFLVIWGLAFLERQIWEQELVRRRVAEQSRINEWEDQFLARQHQEMVRQDEWERELMQRHLAERSRIEDWEQHLEARQCQEKVRQDEWERELKQRHLDERSRVEDWERRLEARHRQEKRRQDEWERRQREIRREETQRQEQERLREDEWQREEEARQKLGLYWDTPVADPHCKAHNSREYWARLLNTVPFDYNWLKPCQDIPLVIHGRSLKTTRCYISQSVSSLNQPSRHK